MKSFEDSLDEVNISIFKLELSSFLSENGEFEKFFDEKLWEIEVLYW